MVKETPKVTGPDVLQKDEQMAWQKFGSRE